jgi:hypothetical protein
MAPIQTDLRMLRKGRKKHDRSLVVIPAKAGIQQFLKSFLDASFRWHDGDWM